jgi:hypothetical protein
VSARYAHGYTQVVRGERDDSILLPSFGFKHSCSRLVTMVAYCSRLIFPVQLLYEY